MKKELKSLSDCKFIDIPRVDDERGTLCFVQNFDAVPFEIKRIFYIFDVPTGSGRGYHAHKTLHEVLICLQGSFDVEVDDGVTKKTFHLNRPWIALHLPPTLWAAEINFDPGTVCLVITSDTYDASDYIRDYDDYRKFRGL